MLNYAEYRHRALCIIHFNLERIGITLICWLKPRDEKVIDESNGKNANKRTCKI